MNDMLEGKLMEKDLLGEEQASLNEWNKNNWKGDS